MTEKFPIILLDDVDYTYPNGTIALKGINLNIYKRELVGIMGKNGAGKTTLIRTFNGLIQPTHGDVYINGVNIKTKNVGVLSQKVGIIFQNPQHQVFSNTVEEEIKYSLNSLNLNKNEIQTKTDEILKKFNLEKYKERSPLNLSGGETKKLAMASIICRDPDILVFDEPTLGQDAKEIGFFMNLLKNEKELGKTIVVVTHNVEFAIEYIPRTILMADGNIIADGPTNKIITNDFLNKQAALILPQVTQLNIELNKIGIKCPDHITSKNEMIPFLLQYLKTKNRNTLGSDQLVNVS